MYRFFTLIVAMFLLTLASAQVTLSPAERFDADPGIIFPEGTQQVDRETCFEVRAFSFERARQQGVDIQGLGCYVRQSQAPFGELLSPFEAALIRAGYRKVYEDQTSEKRTSQTWVTLGFVLGVEHIAEAWGITSYLTLMVDRNRPTVDSTSPVDTLEFDPAVTLPGTALLNEGSTCERSVQNVLAFIESMGRSTYGLEEHRCYLLYPDDWRRTAEEVMRALERASYGERTFTADHLPIIYQRWTHAASRRKLAFAFAPAGMGDGLYIVAFRY